MKPFDLKKAKAGAPVCTRDGKKARILAFDIKGEYPIVAALTTEKEEIECIQSYTIHGRIGTFKDYDIDLMMVSEEVKDSWAKREVELACKHENPSWMAEIKWEE